jgi:hypothetical protein
VARMLDEFPDAQERTEKYPWDQWGNGSVWEIVKGDDFKTELSSMRQTIAKSARKRGMSARTRGYKRDGKEILVFQFVRQNNHKPSGRGARKTGA